MDFLPLRSPHGSPCSPTEPATVCRCPGSLKLVAQPYSADFRAAQDCRQKLARFALPGETTCRWCAGCARAGNYGAIARSKRCEICGLRSANYGLPTEGKARWCAQCNGPRSGNGAVLVGRKRSRAAAAATSGGRHVASVTKCEDCNLKRPTYGLAGLTAPGSNRGRSARW